MKLLRIALFIFLSASFFSGCSESGSGSEETIRISGAGATFPYPVYAQWAHRYEKETAVRINYQSIGSGGGIAQIKARTVDFGASDAPLTPAELKKAGLIQFPMIIGGVVPVINIKGVNPGDVRLTAENLADIFLGKIKKWNDPKIVKNNPDVNFPDRAITTVRRADGSGTTWIFTNYLAKISDEWNEKVGFGKAVSWPEANGVAGKGNEGVAAFVKKVEGAIGYVEFAYALQNKMNYVLLRNKAGNFTVPSIASFQAAAENADWRNAENYYLVLTEQLGKETWPITGASFILMHKNQRNEKRAKEILRFFDWAYKKGGELAVKLDYVPMPSTVVKLVEDSWSREIRVNGKQIWP